MAEEEQDVVARHRAEAAEALGAEGYDPSLGPPPTVRPTAPWWRTALAVTGLVAFALALPLVRVLADAPEFFIAHDLSPSATVRFWLVVTVVVPVLAGLAAVVPLPGGWTLRWPIVAAAGAVAAAGILQPVAGLPVVFWAGTVVIAGLLAHHVGRTSAVTDTLALGAVGCLLLTAWALGPSRTGDYVRDPAATEVAVAAADPAPVVVLVFDEFPTSALLRSDLTIDPERYPNFAALAATSDWYRLAAAGSPNTAYAVPALLSGQLASTEAAPTASAHPTNLFLQLARTHDVHGYESLTALCPPSVCEDGTAPADDPGGPSLRADLGVVLRHTLGTDEMRADLPSITHGWAGFGAGPATADGDGSARELVFDRSTFDRETEAMVALADAPARSGRPSAIIAHATAPHAPWTALPDGGRYPVTHAEGSEVVDSVLSWTDDEPGRRTGYQRLLLQIGALDEVLGQVRDRLEDRGVWDDAVVVVTADHGVGFEPGYWRDATRDGIEVTGIPLFIKAPGQTEGRIDDRSATSADVVPTVLDLAGITSPSRFEGLNLADPEVEVPERRTDAFVDRKQGRQTPDQRLAALEAVVARRASWIDPDGGWPTVFQPGVDDLLVGRPLDDLGAPTPSAGSWTRPPVDTGRLLELTVVDAPTAEADALVVACAGTVVAAAAADDLAEGTVTAFLPAACDGVPPAVALVGGGARWDLVPA